MEIGMGGAVAKMAQAGNEIISVIVTDGRRAPDPSSIGPEKMAEMRLMESQNAARVLGIRDTVFFSFESIVSDTSISEATAKMAALLDSFLPNEVYTLHPELDRHPSHRMAGKLTVEALKKSSRTQTPLWAYEVWGLFPKWDRLEDITNQLETKVAAIGEHKTQVAAVPYIDGIVGLNRWRAVFADPNQSKVEAEYAEVFLRLN